jgi:GWxTD domain-containing protein
MNSGKQSTEESTINVPNPDSKSVHISNIRFLNKPSTDESYFGVNGYSVNTGFDSLKFNFQVTNGREDFPVEIRSKLYRFKSHSAPARPLSGRNYPSSYLESKGIDYSRSDLIQSTSRSLSNRGSVTIENSFTDLSNGNYRFEVEAKTADGDTFFEVRDFGVKSKNFPHVKTPRELALPLVYLMMEDEYNKLLQIQNDDSLKSAIDAFWIRNIKNVPKAKRIIELYYDRVEQANIQFSNFKEGWKTDPGKIYILFGPPLYVDEGFGEMTWFYEFDSGNQVPSIQFEDPRFGNTKFPFDNYILERSKNLFSLEYRQIQSWLDGSILYLSQ